MTTEGTKPFGELENQIHLRTRMSSSTYPWLIMTARLRAPVSINTAGRLLSSRTFEILASSRRI
jgi:hypothetical protein